MKIFMLMYMSGVWYSRECSLDSADNIDESEVANITTSAYEGTPVLFLRELEDAEDIGIDPSEIVNADE